MTRRRSRKRSILLDIIDSLTDLGLKLGGIVFVVVLGYLVYGLFSKNGVGGLTSLPQEDRERVLANIAFACKMLGVSGTIVAITVAARYYVEESLGYMMSLLGVLLYFGSPWAFSTWLSHGSLMANPAVGMIVGEMRLLGIILFLPGTMLIIRDIGSRVRQGFTTVRPRRDSSFLVGKDAIQSVQEERCGPTIYAKCWQMPYCRDFVRKICPAYTSRKSCWRLRSGCFCDEKTMLRALGADGSEARKFAKEVNYRTGSLTGSKGLTAEQKRQLCRNCVIYQFHQAQKYKLASPLVFPAVAIAIWMLYPAMENFFRAAVKFTDQFMKLVTFLPQSQVRLPGAESVPEYVFVLFVAWVAIVAVSYGLRLVEFCIFKMQI